MVDARHRFRSIYETHYDTVHSYCRRRVALESVDDAVADVFLAVWRKIDTIPDQHVLLPWLYRVAYLTLTNSWRGFSRRRALRAKLGGMREELQPRPDEILAINSDVADALKAAARLNPTDQEVLRLSLWEELSAEEIAQVVGIDRNAVYQRLHRAKANLTREFEKIAGRAAAGREDDRP